MTGRAQGCPGSPRDETGSGAAIGCDGQIAKKRIIAASGDWTIRNLASGFCRSFIVPSFAVAFISRKIQVHVHGLRTGAGAQAGPWAHGVDVALVSRIGLGESIKKNGRRAVLPPNQILLARLTWAVHTTQHSSLHSDALEWSRMLCLPVLRHASSYFAMLHLTLPCCRLFVCARMEKCPLVLRHADVFQGASL